MTLMDVLPIRALLGTAAANTATGFITRHTILPVEGRVIAQVFIQDKCVMGVRHSSLLMHPWYTRRLVVLAVLIRRIFVITLVRSNC